MIHKGYIPSLNEAFEYGEKVINEIIPVLLEMSNQDKLGFSEKFHNFFVEKIRRKRFRESRLPRSAK